MIEASSELAVDNTDSTAGESSGVAVSIIVPARNEAEFIRGTLSSLAALDTALEFEIIVVDGNSDDGTRAIAREYGSTIVEEDHGSIATARNIGAKRASGEWLAFIDADPRVRADYLTEMCGFVEANGLAAASSRCRITGPWRAKVMEATINHVFPRLERPVLPGFNCFVHRRAFEDVGGFPTVPNEDTAFSRRLARRYPTAYAPDVLVASSGRRIAETGLTGTLWHYVRLDAQRLRS